MRAAKLTSIAAIAILAVGCGAVNRISESQFTESNYSMGKTLFIEKCAACHTFADAKTTGTVGPDLDNAFFADKQQGFHQSTIADVVRGQIAYPEADTGTGSPGMTPNLLHGQEARDVAVYVAHCAANSACNVTAAPEPKP